MDTGKRIAVIAVAIISAAFLMFVAQANSATIFEYTGSGDPTGQGWSAFGGSGTSSGPVGPENAWNVNDSSLAVGSTLFYSQTPTAGNQADGASNGWSLSTRLKMVTGNPSGLNTIFVDYIDGATQWLMFFSTSLDGDTIVSAQTASGPFDSFEVNGSAGQYNDYSMVFDPLSGTADLFVDGVEQISNYGGISQAFSRVAWGAGADNGTGEANFESVTFDVASAVVPEPGTLLIFGLGLIGLGLTRHRVT